MQKKLNKLLGPMPSFQKAVFLWNQHALRKKLLRTSTLFQQRTKALFWHKNAQMQFLLWQHKVMKNIRLWLQFVSKKVLLWKQKMSPISFFVALQLQLTLSNKNIFLRVRSFHFHQSARAILESRDFKRTPQYKIFQNHVIRITWFFFYQSEAIIVHTEMYIKPPWTFPDKSKQTLICTNKLQCTMNICITKQSSINSCKSCHRIFKSTLNKCAGVHLMRV